jgi:hypothetical protein
MRTCGSRGDMALLTAAIGVGTLWRGETGIDDDALLVDKRGDTTAVSGVATAIDARADATACSLDCAGARDDGTYVDLLSVVVVVVVAAAAVDDIFDVSNLFDA